MKKANTPSYAKPAALAFALVAAALIMLAGCGGGGNTLPYVPQNEAKECSSGPTGTAARVAGSPLPFSSIWCVQIHRAGEQTPILKNTTVTVPSGGSLSLEAIVYDAACGNLTSSFAYSLMWSASTTAIGTLTGSYSTASLTAPAVTSDATGTITVSVYDGTSYVKQDTIDVLVKAPNTPNAPTGLTATAGNAQVALSWTAPTANTDASSLTDLAGYNVYQGTASGGPYTQINTGTVTATNYTATGLTNGTAYYFVVTAVDNESPVNQSADSTEATATPSVAATPTTPSAPTGLAATAGNAQAALTWTAPTTNTDASSLADLAGYNVYQGTASGGPYTQVNGATVTGTAYTATGLTNGTAYYFVVRAVDSESPVNESSNSNEISATPTAAATTFKQTYAPTAGTGYDVGSSVAQTSDGGYILVGFAPSGTGWAVKTDSAGTSSWTYVGAGINFHDVIQTTDGGYLIGGDQSGTAALVKLTSAGSASFTQTYAGISHAYGVAESGGNYLFAGDNGNDGVLALVNSAGTLQWSVTYDGGTTNEFLKNVFPTSDGGFVMGGYTGDGTTDDNIWLVKTDSAGTQQINQTYLGGNSLFDHAVGALPFGSGYILGGYSSNTTYSDSDCRVVITNAAGTQTATYTHGGTSTDFCYAFNTTSDGGYVLGGSSSSTGTNGLEDFLLVKAGSGGVEAFSVFFGDANNQFPNGVIQTSDGGFAVLGGTNISGGDWDWWLVKTDGSGLSP